MNNEHYNLPENAYNLLLDFEQIVSNFIDCRRLLHLVDLNVINIHDNVINIIPEIQNMINAINNEWYINLVNNGIIDIVGNFHNMMRNILTLNNHVHMIYQNNQNNLAINYRIRRASIINLHESVEYLQNYLRNNQNNQNI